MVKFAGKGHILGLLAVVIFLVSCNKQEISPQEQARRADMVEVLADLTQNDMVLHRNGFIYMVTQDVNCQDEIRSRCSLSLRREYNAPKDFAKWHIGLWSERIDRVYHKDDPQWSEVTLCYLQNCHWASRLEAGFIKVDQ